MAEGGSHGEERESQTAITHRTQGTLSTVMLTHPSSCKARDDGVLMVPAGELSVLSIGVASRMWMVASDEVRR